jgi:hypothetical protein
MRDIKTFAELTRREVEIGNAMQKQGKNPRDADQSIEVYATDNHDKRRAGGID